MLAFNVNNDGCFYEFISTVQYKGSNWDLFGSTSSLLGNVFMYGNQKLSSIFLMGMMIYS